MALAATTPTNMPNVAVAPRAAFLRSADAAAATITLATTRGTTVIRIALIQIVPIGAAMAMTWSATPPGTAATKSPAIVPSTTAITICTDSFFMRSRS